MLIFLTLLLVNVHSIKAYSTSTVASGFEDENDTITFPNILEQKERDGVSLCRYFHLFLSSLFRVDRILNVFKQEKKENYVLKLFLLILCTLNTLQLPNEKVNLPLPKFEYAFFFSFIFLSISLNSINEKNKQTNDSIKCTMQEF